MSHNPADDSTSGEVVIARPILSATPEAPRRRLRSLPPLQISRAAAALDLGLILFVTIVLPVLLPATLRGALSSHDAPPPHTAALILDKWVALVTAATLMAYLVYRTPVAPAALGLRLSGLGSQLLWSLGALGAMYVALLATTLFVLSLLGLHPPAASDLKERVQFMKLLPLDDWGGTVLLLICVAAHEEIVFRALLVPYMGRVCGSMLAGAFVSTALFAVLHVAQGWLAIVQILGVGMALALVFILSRSLIAVIVAHFAFNVIQFRLSSLARRFIEQHGGFESLPSQ